jgi:hypothetical protein
MSRLIRQVRFHHEYQPKVTWLLDYQLCAERVRINAVKRRTGRPCTFAPRRDKHKGVIKMKWVQTSNLGMLLLGIWLILTGLLPFVTITFVNMGLVLSVLAIIAGVCILIGR